MTRLYYQYKDWVETGDEIRDGWVTSAMSGKTDYLICHYTRAQNEHIKG